MFDVDGTLVHRAGDDLHVQPGAREVLARIRASGRPLALFTNGSHETPEGFAAGLRGVGLDVADDELLTPLRSVLVYLREHGYESVLLLGSDPAREFLEQAGVLVLAGEDATDADVVFVATPAAFDFGELERAARTVLGGAPLLTGSYAPAYAGANGPIISRGAMVTAALAKASGARPVIVGKPSRAALRTISDQVGARSRELAVIGDDVTMDIALGRMGDSRTILVRSGISGPVEPEALPRRHRPDAVVDGIAELLDWL
ncbi:MAG: HAD-IIA family hydrolase [Gaiellaceae bacterium]